MKNILRTLLLLLCCSGIASAQEAPDSALMDSFRKLEARGEANDPKALYDLAMVYERGYGPIEADSILSSRFLMRSAEAGFPAALNLLGFRYYKGEGVEKDTARALDLIQRAADAGDPKAFNNLGWLLAEGEGVERDYAKAAYWLQRASDADLPVAMTQLADLYRQGLGVEKDSVQAVDLYTRAIAAGLPDAERKLLAMKYADYRRLPPDEAVELGRYYYSRRAPSIGVTLFEIAAEHDNPTALALLGDAYSRALGVPYDYDKSLEYYFRAARAGNPSAQFVLGELLQMLPDALDTLPDTLVPDADERDPYYWLQQASLAGIEDASTASRRLLH